MRTGVQAFLDLLAEFGVRHIFGNPGTTELPLYDALAGDDRFRHILGLQEVPVVSMADGFAMASGTVGVVNLHTCCGLGNGMGMLFNAFREGTPLLVTAGQQDRRLKFEEPILAGDMVSVTKPWTKSSVEVDRIENLPTAVRRAVQTALTPPTGPVFMSLPIDVQMESSDSLDMSPIQLPDPHTRPPARAIQRAAEVLLAANSPAILAGSRVTELEGMDELVSVAERLGAPVFSESGATHGRLAFPSDHPLNGGCLPLWSPDVRQRLQPFDVVLVVGMDLLRQYVYHEPARPIPEQIRLVQIDEDPRQLGKNYAVEVGVVGHTKTSLAELGELLREAMTPQQQQAASRRADQWAEQRAAAQRKLESKAEAERDLRPMTPLTLMHAIADVLPPDAAVVEEAVTTTNTTLERLGALKNTTGYFSHRGWALGWGLGCAIGARLAWPDRPVLGLIGDGAAMYGIQALWSAAHYNIPVTFVICNNAQYQILKIGAKGFGLPQAQSGAFESMDLVKPEIDFVSLATALGVNAMRMSDPDELSQSVSQSLSGDRPLLIDVPISRDVSSRLKY